MSEDPVPRTRSRGTPRSPTLARSPPRSGCFAPHPRCGGSIVSVRGEGLDPGCSGASGGRCRRGRSPGATSCEAPHDARSPGVVNVVKARSLGAAASHCLEPAGTLFARHGQVAAVAEHLEVLEVVRAGNQSIGADQRLDVVHLETELVAEVLSPRSRVTSDLRGLEAAPFARPLGSTARRSTSSKPDVIPFELAGVKIGAIGRAARRQGRSAALDAAERLGQVDTRHVRLP